MLVALILTALIGVGVGFIPQFGGPGYEVSLVYGLVLPTILAIASASDLARFEPEPFDAYCRGVAHGVLVFAIAALISIVHGLFRGFCDPFAGILNLIFGPGIGLALAGAWSSVAFEVGRRFRRKRLGAFVRVLVAFGAPVGSILVGLARFYTSPMIFGYDPFVGYFSGTLYDTVVSLDGLYTYRVGSIATLFAAFVAALHLAHDPEGKLVYQSIGRPGLLLLSIVCAAGSMGLTLAGPELGHWQTKSTIARDLGAVVEGERCTIVHARAISPEAAQRFARECEAHVAQAEAWLGVRGPERITAFLFETAAQKSRLMGAAGTNIAKFWRAEVYVQGTSFPHRVLGHEIVHAVAAGAGRGPFKIAGRVGGLLPNPGLIEGVAVAASPRDEDLSPMDWAKAMRDLGILPPLERLFALAFLGEASSTAYTVSGAFVGWVHDTFGADVVVSWYRGGDLPTITGKSWQELETAWHAELDEIELPPAVRVQAAARFDKPGFFARRCPRVIDRCRDKAADLEESGDVLGAMAEIDRALELEPSHVGLQTDRAELSLFTSKPEEAEAELTRIAADESIPRHSRDRAMRLLADKALAKGDVEAARKGYEDVMKHAVDADSLRTLQVKLAACKDEGLREAIVALLIGPVARRADRLVATELLGGLDRERSGDGLPAYLLARGRLDAGDFEGAAEHLDSALARKLEVPYVRAEALRLRIVVACGLFDGATATRWLGEYAREPEVTRARYDIARRLVARCGGGETGTLPPYGRAE